MNGKGYRDIFPKRHTFLPVVHVRDAAQAERNTRIALGEGADGVFLINHDIGVDDLLGCYDYVRGIHPRAWIGLNMLGIHKSVTSQLARLTDGLSGLWVDDGGINWSYKNPATMARAFWESLSGTGFKGLYFGGVAFKGQVQPPDPGQEAKLASPYMDVVTTSGDQTGMPPPLVKIIAMKEAVPEGVLGNASGLGPDNMDPYLPYVDALLIATKIGKGFYELDPALVRKVSTKLANYNAIQG